MPLSKHRICLFPQFQPHERKRQPCSNAATATMKRMDVFKDIWSWNVDIDKYINPYVPRSQLYRFPYPLAYVLGYRKEPTRPLGNIWVKLWSFIGAFVSLVFIAGVTKSSPLLQRHHPPLLFASFVSPPERRLGILHSLTQRTGRRGDTAIQRDRVSFGSTS